mmetsp:Transcript_22489/g.64669  ORF Transcript_22489/g.64669 Transcript_22489/m.64669 type:complete len:358 (-) Transcript_22489:67-1140(-)
MIWKKLFPTEGGGALRRWAAVRKDLFDINMDKELLYKVPLTFFDFRRPGDAADALVAEEGPTKGGWRLSDDGVIDGYSRGTMKLIQSTEDYRRHMNLKPYVLEGVRTSADGTQTKENETEIATAEQETNIERKQSGAVFRPGDEAPSVLDEIAKKNEKLMEERKNEGEQPFIPFIRWEGTLDTRVGENSKATRSGFCAARSPEFPLPINLKNNYNALEIMCRSDGRTYTVNLKISTFMPDDLYQGYITVPPTHKPGAAICERTGGEFVTLFVPFNTMILTSQGRMREVQRELDGLIKIENVGITLMDNVDGDFQFDLARIRAVNVVQGEVIEKDQEEEKKNQDGDDSMSNRYASTSE